MSRETIEAIVADVLSAAEEHVKENQKGLSAIDSPYWCGRLFESEDMQKKLSSIIQKYTSV